MVVKKVVNQSLESVVAVLSIDPNASANAKECINLYANVYTNTKI